MTRTTPMEKSLTQYPVTWPDLRSGERVLFCRLYITLRERHTQPHLRRDSQFESLTLEPGLRIPVETPARLERAALVRAYAAQVGDPGGSLARFAECVAEQDSEVDLERLDTTPAPEDASKPTHLPPLPPRPLPRGLRPPTRIKLPVIGQRHERQEETTD